MATATKKKANKKPARKAKSSGTATKASANTVKARTKVKALAKVKTATKGQATQASTAPTKPATKTVNKSGVTKKAVVKNTEPCTKQPDRSSPAMAEVDADVLEFIAAIDEFKQVNGRPFPSWSEVLLVVRQLGYRRA